jgi:hypothetical protein
LIISSQNYFSKKGGSRKTLNYWAKTFFLAAHRTHAWIGSPDNLAQINSYSVAKSNEPSKTISQLISSFRIIFEPDFPAKFPQLLMNVKPKLNWPGYLVDSAIYPLEHLLPIVESGNARRIKG